jgi:hypothetical protein
MTADVVFGQLTPFLRKPATGGTRVLSLRRSSGRRSEIDVAGPRRRARHSSSSHAVDTLAYDSDDYAEDPAPREALNTREADHDKPIFELSDDPSDDHWAHAPEQIDDMTWDSASEAH